MQPKGERVKEITTHRVLDTEERDAEISLVGVDEHPRNDAIVLERLRESNNQSSRCFLQLSLGEKGVRLGCFGEFHRTPQLPQRR